MAWIFCVPFLNGVYYIICMPKPKTHERVNVTIPISMMQKMRSVRVSTGLPVSQQIVRAMKKNFLGLK